MTKSIEDILLEVQNPGRYIGGEFGSVDITRPYDFTFCLVFPDIYEIGMSNLGLKILYDILNKEENILCERAYAPWIDMGKAMFENNIELFSLETKRKLKDFDILGFSIQYEMAYTNILYMLDLANIPFYAKDRDDSFPILFAGGPCTANPEPFADFFDIICIGDGEEVNLAVAKIARKYRNNKSKILEECKKIKGVYIPSLSKMEDGVCIEHVEKAVVKDLDRVSFPTKIIVPNIKIVHDRPVVELFRGCYAGCRFCQACFFYRPIRVREHDTVIDYVQQLIKNTGYDEVGLSSLSTGDYINIEDLVEKLGDFATKNKIRLQLPSLRLDTYNNKISRFSRQSSLTFAPEAGTQRLRNVINKNITDEDIEKTIVESARQGYRSIKLYFMIGHPTETEMDLDGIAAICHLINRKYKEITGKRDLSISLSAAVFVPKPLTPFQWVEQISREEIDHRQTYLRQKLRYIKNVSYKWHDMHTSFIEAVFARGDRALSKLIVQAYINGAKFDGWGDQFNIDIWENSAKTLNISLEDYVRERDIEERLPWDFIDFGVSKDYLLKEYKKAMNGETTDSCMYKCNNCGANTKSKCRQQLLGN